MKIYTQSAVFRMLRKGLYPSAFLLLIVFASLLSYGQSGVSKEIFEKRSESVYVLGGMEINTEKKTVSIPCAINMNDGLLEVVLCRKEGKVHESLLSTKITPVEFQTAMLLLGLDPVNEIPADDRQPDPTSNFKTIETPGDSVVIFLEYLRGDQMKRDRLEQFINNQESNALLEESTWLFRGAVTAKNDWVIVDPEITFIATYHDPVALMELNAQSKFNDELYYVNKAKKLVIGEPVTLIIQALN